MHCPHRSLSLWHFQWHSFFYCCCSSQPTFNLSKWWSSLWKTQAPRSLLPCPLSGWKANRVRLTEVRVSQAVKVLLPFYPQTLGKSEPTQSSLSMVGSRNSYQHYMEGDTEKEREEGNSSQWPYIRKQWAQQSRVKPTSAWLQTTELIFILIHGELTVKEQREQAQEKVSQKEWATQ